MCAGPISRCVRSQGNTAQEDANVTYIHTQSGIRRRDPTLHMVQSYMHLYDIVYLHVNEKFLFDIRKVEYIDSRNQKQRGSNATPNFP